VVHDSGASGQSLWRRTFNSAAICTCGDGRSGRLQSLPIAACESRRTRGQSRHQRMISLEVPQPGAQWNRSLHRARFHLIRHGWSGPIPHTTIMRPSEAYSFHPDATRLERSFPVESARFRQGGRQWLALRVPSTATVVRLAAPPNARALPRSHLGRCPGPLGRPSLRSPPRFSQ